MILQVGSLTTLRPSAEMHKAERAEERLAHGLVDVLGV